MVDPDDEKRLSPLASKHFHVQGRYHFALTDEAVRRGELAQSVLSSDDAVDALRSAFFHELISFMQREPNHIPQGVNLLSIVRNLERVADHATNIAEDVFFYIKGIGVRHHAEVVAKN